MTERGSFFSPRHSQLLKFAAWARNLAWAALVVYILWAGLKLLIFFQGQDQFFYGEGIMGRFEFIDLIQISINMVVLIFQGVVYFLILNGVSLGLNMVVETDVNYREREKGRSQMSPELRDQIYENLKFRETDDLLEIWKTNDQSKWSDLALEVIHQVLGERGVEIPPQDEPIFEHEGEASDDEKDGIESLEEWELRLVDRDDQPEFYDILEVLDIHHRLNWAAKASIVVYVLSGLFSLPLLRSLWLGIVPTTNELIPTLIPSLTLFLGYGLQIFLTYYTLKAFSSILRILMEMEFNSRAAK